MQYFKLREEGGEYIQDVTEMTKIPVILKTDLTKSPPYVFLTVDHSSRLSLTFPTLDVYPSAR